MSLLYFFDIGNTSGKFWRLSWGVVEAKVVLLHERCMQKLVSDLPHSFDEVPDEICGLAVLSPSAVQEFVRLCENRWGKTPRLAQSQAYFEGLRNGYALPERLGVDRWIGLIGAGSQSQSICVVSCGTALTIDVMKQGSHEGGYILPGLSLMSECLCIHTAGVRFDSRVEESLELGRSTSEAVLNGAITAVVSLVERVVIHHQVSELVLTGGGAGRVSGFLNVPHVVEPDLALSGLRKYFQSGFAEPRGEGEK